MFEAERFRDYRTEFLPKDFIEAAEAAIGAFVLGTPPEDNPHLTYPNSLPRADLVPISPELAQCSTLIGVYGYCSLVLFMVGKNITNENRTSITTQRPNALIRRYKCESVRYVLDGDGRMADDCHAFIHSGWVRSTGPRIVTVRHFAAITMQKSQQLTHEVIAMTFSMLEWSNAQAVYFINNLLMSCPWAARIPALQASYKMYARSVRALHTQPAWYRPYYKMAMQDSTKLFRRRDMDPLIAVAVYWARQGNQTAVRYAVPDGQQGAVDAFVREATDRGIHVVPIADQTIVTATQ